MPTQVQNQLASSRFINMCVSNGFLHLYIYSMLPLLCARAEALGVPLVVVGWAVVAFAVGMVLPGPFGAHLMERRSRKEVFLKAMVVMGIVPTLGYISVPAAWALVCFHGIQGMAFGVAQTALGTTLVNDVLLSKYRNRGDFIYAWAGRLGVPLGLLVGYVLVRNLPFPDACWWALVPCFLSFLLVAQTQIPIKAPVKVPLLTCDRFFLPQSYPLIITMFAAPWTIGRVVGSGLDAWDSLGMAVGVIAAFASQVLARRRMSRRGAVCIGFVIMMAAWLLVVFPNVEVRWVACLLAGGGAGIVSSRHLMDWVATAEHCQRGTAQNTYMISWRVAFAAGFLYTSYFAMEQVIHEVLFCTVSLLLYLLWASKRVAKAKV